MTFLWSYMLWLLLLVPVLSLFYVWSQRRRQKYVVRFASLSLVKEAIGRGPGLRRHIPPALFLLGLTIMILALARPHGYVTVFKQEGTVILAIDVSGSMLADDLKPDRMEAAKNAALAFVEKQPQGVRMGVVSFTDNAALVQAPTTDKETVKAAIKRLQAQRGTAIGRGLQASLDAIAEEPQAPLVDSNSSPFVKPTPRPTPTPLPKGEYAPAIIVLMTDGENNLPPEPLEVAPQAVQRGIRVFTVGVGSPDGAILKIQGRSVRTRLDEATLKRIAEMTDGEYYNASTETDLKKVYENLGTNVVQRTEQTEITAYFTGVAIALTMLGGLLSLFWFSRLP
jgi:Ca-activated chloride channel family protein